MSGERTALVVGSGGREHALAEQLAPTVDTLYFTGENAGIESLSNAQQVPPSEEVAAYALAKEVDLVVIGPEQPLVDGLSDQLRAEGITVFGPSKEAAQLEASKKAGREFANRNGIPTPQWEHVTSMEGYDEVVRRLGSGDVIPNLVGKIDGLAGGKGVLVADTWAQLDAFARGSLSGELFGGAGKDNLLVEERLHGPEVSMFVLSDGENFSILPLTQDYKRRDEGDRGPNTGGTGALTLPDGVIVAPWQFRQMQEIARKSVKGMKAEGTPYKGVLYVGLMLAEEHGGAPVVIEYNVRFGDPEAEVLAPSLGARTFDILASTDKYLRADLLPKKTGQMALTVCLMANEYPDGKSHGVPIYGLDREYEGVTVYHGGTARQEDQVITNGGRVLYVTGHGDTPEEAARRAYAAIGADGVHFDNMHHRRDIGWQVLQAA